MSYEEKTQRGLYFTIIDGSFRTQVEESHPEAVRREYETKTGAKAVKYERIVKTIGGIIENVNFYENDYGKTINIKFDANENGQSPIVSISISSSYGEDLLKKLPSIDFTKDVKLSPYSFTNDFGKEVRGISVLQDDKKIKNFFFDAEKNENINGYPIAEGKENYGKEDWKIYFLQARKFLIEYTTKNIISKFQNKNFNKVRGEKQIEYDNIDDGVNPNDIPF